MGAAKCSARKPLYYAGNPANGWGDERDSLIHTAEVSKTLLPIGVEYIYAKAPFPSTLSVELYRSNLRQRHAALLEKR
jgi:hypothetical protein